MKNTDIGLALTIILIKIVFALLFFVIGIKLGNAEMACFSLTFAMFCAVSGLLDFYRI